tara:strand:- start:1247 stop:1588 length:342 start_codon:yes stop_codon:yes gene_type:complete
LLVSALRPRPLEGAETKEDEAAVEATAATTPETGDLEVDVESLQKEPQSFSKLLRLLFSLVPQRLSAYETSLVDGEATRESEFLPRRSELVVLMQQLIGILTRKANVTSSRLW